MALSTEVAHLTQILSAIILSGSIPYTERYRWLRAHIENHIGRLEEHSAYSSHRQLFHTYGRQGTCAHFKLKV